VNTVSKREPNFHVEPKKNTDGVLVSLHDDQDGCVSLRLGLTIRARSACWFWMVHLAVALCTYILEKYAVMDIHVKEWLRRDAHAHTYIRYFCCCVMKYRVLGLLFVSPKFRLGGDRIIPMKGRFTHSTKLMYGTLNTLLMTTCGGSGLNALFILMFGLMTYINDLRNIRSKLAALDIKRIVLQPVFWRIV
jgi:hypothetical protein